MRFFDQVAGTDGGVPRWRRPRVRLSRPSGIRNGGLLLVLVALAAVMALVDEPPEPGAGGRLPGIFQHLPPPVGITGLPPAVAQPSTPPAGDGVGALADDGQRPASTARGHPRRQHPRPARPGSSGSLGGDGVTRPVGGGGQGGTGAPAPPVSAPPVPAPPVAATPAARVRVPPVTVRVTPPAVLGRDLPEAQAETPEVGVDTPAVEVPRLRLG